MSSGTALDREIEAVLKSRRQVQEKPNNDVLLPVYRYLVPPSDAASSSTLLSKEDHWYCDSAQSPLHIEAATYLIFLFAFQRQGTSKTWVDKLEVVTASCEKCARGFGSARRRLETAYLSDWPIHVRKNFFAAVDKWQSGVILKQVDKIADPGYGKEAPTCPALYSLDRSVLQLLFGEPTLLAVPQIASLIEEAVNCPTHLSTNLVTLGVTPVHCRLLASADPAKRQWCLSQFPAASRRPLTFSEWCSLGIGSEIQSLYLDGEIGGDSRWETIKSIVEEKILDQETVESGLLGGQLERDIKGRVGRGVMSALSGLLSSDVPYFASVLSCFSSLLRVSPTRHVWSFDPSPDLPHTLVSEIRINAAFQRLLEESFPAPLGPQDGSEDLEKSLSGKGKKRNNGGPLDWLSDYLRSVADTDTIRDSVVGKDKVGSSGTAFAEALAVTLHMVFQEMQHARLSDSLRAAAALAGFNALVQVYRDYGSKSESSSSAAISSSLNLHSSFITTVAFRSQDHPLPAWSESRGAARDLLTTIFQADAQSMMDGFMTIAEITHAEKKRQRKKKLKAADVPVANWVDHLPVVSARKDLWSMAYDCLSPSDSLGAAMLINSLAPLSPLELLDRHASWTHHGLEQVIKKEEWVTGIRAFNSAINATRGSFPRAIESLASQADPSIIKSLWEEPGVPKAIILLLLSPDDEIHTPIISIIQQSFEDVDDRGDCFRAVLQHYPCMAIDGLNEFLRTFFKIARTTTESCSLAKWLVRCFHDVLEVLCQPSGSSVPFLQADEFLSLYSDGKSMTKRLEELWHLMTTSLALIFKRTLDWAPYFENEVMVDWMRDALIFGRQMTDHIRLFEAAVLRSHGGAGVNPSESPARQSLVGRKMTKQLELVLTDLILWLRLTDVETLFQTHQLIKTILSRISKASTDLSKNPILEKTLIDIDKFCRKASRSFTSRLTDDLTSELSELLEPFDLEDQTEIQFLREVKLRPSSDAGTSRESTPKGVKPTETKAPLRNAFTEMMKASGAKAASSSKTPNLGTKSTARPQPAADGFEDDDFLSNLSASDLAIIEKRAILKQQTSIKPMARGKLHTISRTLAPSSKFHLDLTNKAAPKPTTSFQSKIMKDLRREHHTSLQERKRLESGQVAPRLPTASVLGTGLGAYTGPPKPTVKEVSDSGSSASDSSDDEATAQRLLAKQKPLLPKPAQPAVEKRSIKVIGDPMADIQRRNEERRAKAHATKMRLKPDLSFFYRCILSWNPDHSGSTAPHGPKVAATLAKMYPVPTTFNSVKQYEQIMRPLFFQELWCQIAKEQGLSGATVSVEVASRQYEDDFIEIDLLVTGSGEFFCNDSDLVILRQPKNPNAVFAKVMAFKRQHKGSTLRVRIISEMDQRDLCGKSKWQLRKHVSLSTAIREFGALQGLPWYESGLLSDILTGRSAVIPKIPTSEIGEAMKSLSLNESQAKAVLGAMDMRGFSLIQGPPGTGKTKTIGGLVGKWMSDRSIPISLDGRPAVKPKLLICAPSNAAIDEVCKRLILGVPNPDGGVYTPNIVRIGIDSSVNMAVKDVSLDSLVEAQVNIGPGKTEGDYSRIQGELDDIKKKIKVKQEAISQAGDHDEKRKGLENEYHALITRRTQLGQAASKAKDAARDATRHLDGARRAAREQIMNEADVICATLSGAGHDSLAAHVFETVIIDEAAQAIEASCLIPLKYGCRRCIMVGDPNQLPPTTFSTDAEKFQYNKSLFVRMTKYNASHVQLLNTQYRMHPFISELPSKVFYNGQLKDGPAMDRKTAAIWHQKNIFGPYRFFNLEGTEVKAGTSTKNPEEALAAVELYRRLSSDFGSRIDLAMRVGIITMYKEQLWEMKRRFTAAFGASILELVEFNTVDGFQGQEKDIIILSCVRSGPNLQQIGFLKDTRRMNVALTRAKSSLFVFGNASTLERSDANWRTIVSDARDRGFFINYTSTTFSSDNSTPPRINKKSKGASSAISRASPVPSVATAKPEGLMRPKELAMEITSAAHSKRNGVEEAVKEAKKRPKISPASPATIMKPAESTHKPQPSGSSKAARPPPPPEDVLFIKKKKKKRL